MTENILKKYKKNIYSVLEEDEEKHIDIITFDDVIYYYKKEIENNNIYNNISNLEKSIKNININNKTNDKSTILGKRKYEDYNMPCKSYSIGCGIFD